MDVTAKVKKEIERLEKLVADSEAILDQVPSHLRPYQEKALELQKSFIAKLEYMLANKGK